MYFYPDTFAVKVQGNQAEAGGYICENKKIRGRCENEIYTHGRRPFRNTAG